jgi:hypothetical protein
VIFNNRRRRHGAQSELEPQNGAPSRASPDNPYCEFKDDRERRTALVSRDLRIVGCRLVTVAGLVTLALNTPAGSMVGLIARMLGRI